MATIPYHQIRATYTASTIVVYQAYNSTIATAAVAAQSLSKIAQFKPHRMTWIKPSFRWMLYRSGWASKQNQEHILAIHLTREGWEQALLWSGTREDEKCVRVQWDPERGMRFEPLGHRSIQVGLSGRAVEQGLFGGWIVKIEGVTELARRIGVLVEEGKVDAARELLPQESEYTFLNDEARIACDAHTS